MRVQNTIRQKLTEAFEPDRLEIVDDSARHAGHAGARPEGESHFSVEIVSARFEGLSRIERQRLVHAALRAELETDVHALALRTRTPAEEAG